MQARLRLCRRRALRVMNGGLLLLIGLGAGLVLSRRKPEPALPPPPSSGGESAVSVERGLSYRLRFGAPFPLEHETARQSELRFELLPLGAYDIDFRDRSNGQAELGFTITPNAATTLHLGSPLNATGSIGPDLLLESVTPLGKIHG